MVHICSEAAVAIMIGRAIVNVTSAITRPSSTTLPVYTRLVITAMTSMSTGVKKPTTIMTAVGMMASAANDVASDEDGEDEDCPDAPGVGDDCLVLMTVQIGPAEYGSYLNSMAAWMSMIRIEDRMAILIMG